MIVGKVLALSLVMSSIGHVALSQQGSVNDVQFDADGRTFARIGKTWYYCGSSFDETAYFVLDDCKPLYSRDELDAISRTNELRARVQAEREQQRVALDAQRRAVVESVKDLIWRQDEFYELILPKVVEYLCASETPRLWRDFFVRSLMASNIVPKAMGISDKTSSLFLGGKDIQAHMTGALDRSLDFAVAENILAMPVRGMIEPVECG